MGGLSPRVGGTEEVSDPADMHQVDSSGLTALHLAVRQRQVDDVSACLKSGVDIDAQDVEGDTALHLASAAGNVEIVKMLRDSGASARLRNSDGDTPYDLAKCQKTPGLVDTIGCWWQ
mmetsp:Transcript_39915/g.55491  ORF Transcript_39915/g.55491 Transcript_39915/m.55491 type:complete len:118 (-) Transcript_39915:105-458(-)|eukprot:CAMPEP_0196570284 /NCGR_PEP_ID=MMETSP1081-20130531/268_1 /TAXON_ID=36882 /ORGANISM="Pyramimonas amylifera, Strain CCMP720" /LENGTH=117 /DNA_ID=CAMNT_0041886623 /DNA_START=98 /DNA_END=451 /DNA_ORIENTATION=+